MNHSQIAPNNERQNKMKTIQAKDQYGRTCAVTVPAQTALCQFSVGIYGWHASVRTRTGDVVSFHNGEPFRIEREGKEVWSHIRHWGKRGKVARRADYEAQAAYWRSAFNQSVSFLWH